MMSASAPASSSFTSAAVAVDKATSDLLLSPDWSMNIEICDVVNSNQWQAKDVVKALKRRLQHKSSRVQMLALTLLESMVKNCGDIVHFQIGEKNILGDMVKIVKKKFQADMQVRDKILVLLDSWQAAFGGPRGKYPQYYVAYHELKRAGIQFPQHSSDSVPIVTPPATRPTLRNLHPGSGMPSGSFRRLDETMATEPESLSLSSLDSIRDTMDLLNDMLQAVDANDRTAVKDEVIVDLVAGCRSNQKKLMQMLTTTGDEELLARGLDLNDGLQSLLAKHDAIASGISFPIHPTTLKPPEVSSSPTPTEIRDSSSVPSSSSPAPVSSTVRSQIDDEEEEEDDFTQLARRHSKPQHSNISTESNEGLLSIDDCDPIPCNALALSDPPPALPIASKEQDIIDLLSLTLSTDTTTPRTSEASSTPNHKMHQTPNSTAEGGSPQSYHGNQGQLPFNNYVVPWAQQTQSGPHAQPPVHQRSSSHPEFYAQAQSQFQVQPHPEPHLQMQQPPNQNQSQWRPTQYSQNQYGYPPPPWATSNDYSPFSNNMGYNPYAQMNSSYTPMQGNRTLQHQNTFPTRGSNEIPVSSGIISHDRTAGQKSFTPTYKLFDDLNVFGNGDGRVKVTGNASPSMSGNPSQGMIGGTK